MTISVIREVTTEDNRRLFNAAVRFCQRHYIPMDGPDGEEPEVAVEYWIESAHPDNQAYRRKLWTGVMCRALRVPHDVRTTTDYGYIGLFVD